MSLGTSIDKMKDNGFKLTKERSYLAQTNTDVDYTDDMAPLQMHLPKPKHGYIVWKEQLQG